MGWLGRARKGTGLAGSETYSSNAVSDPAGARKPSLSPASRYSGFIAGAEGHACKLCQRLTPVSKAVTGATDDAGASSFR